MAAALEGSGHGLSDCASRVFDGHSISNRPDAIEQSFPQAVRWAWASTHAAASCFRSAAAICLAIYIGLRATVLMGAFLYLCALSVLWLRRSAVAPQVRAEAVAPL